MDLFLLRVRINTFLWSNLTNLIEVALTYLKIPIESKTLEQMIQLSKGLKNIVIIRKWEKTIGINSTNLLNKLKMKENKMTNLPIRCKWIMNQKSRN